MKYKRLRVWLLERIIHWFIIPLAGRGVQVQRQDEVSRSLDSPRNDKWLHHAPMCGANHYHHTRRITSRCTCGAEAAWRRRQPGAGLIHKMTLQSGVHTGPANPHPAQPQQQIPFGGACRGLGERGMGK